MESEQEYKARLDSAIDKYCFVRGLERDKERMAAEIEDLCFFFFCIVMFFVGFYSDRIVIYMYNALDTLTR